MEIFCQTDRRERTQGGTDVLGNVAVEVIVLSCLTVIFCGLLPTQSSASFHSYIKGVRSLYVQTTGKVYFREVYRIKTIASEGQHVN